MHAYLHAQFKEGIRFLNVTYELYNENFIKLKEKFRTIFFKFDKLSGTSFSNCMYIAWQCQKTVSCKNVCISNDL